MTSKTKNENNQQYPAKWPVKRSMAQRCDSQDMKIAHGCKRHYSSLLNHKAFLKNR